MIKNGSFENGWTDLTSEIQQPNDWTVVWTNGVPTYDNWMTCSPEVVHKSKNLLPPEERNVYVKDGDWCLKVFASYRAINVNIKQQIDLSPGLYRLSVYAFVDTFQWDNGKKPPNPNNEAMKRAARLGLYVGDQVRWFDESNTKNWYINGHDLSAEFAITRGGSYDVGFEMWNPWPISNNGWFIDRTELIQVEGNPIPSGRGSPREQYERAYILMPPDYDKDWVMAAAEARWDTHRNTIGGSADDAGIGDLDNRTVIAVNPKDWRDGLKEFYEEHYPGVRYVPVTADSPSELYVKLRHKDGY